MIKRHNDFCGCDYCKLLETYVSLKKHNHRFLKHYESEAYNGEPAIEREYVNHYRTTEVRIHELKVEKDKLKTI